MATKKATSPKAAPPPKAAAPAGPCKITALPSGEFQARAADMPVSCQLSTPDSKTEFLSVAVYESGAPVTGQPTNQSGTSFTLTLPIGDYVVYIVVGCLPSAKPVWVVESCGGQTKLDWIATPVSTAGQFALQVI